jgi:hypothetical protein
LKKHWGYRKRRLTAEEAGELLGMSARNFNSSLEGNARRAIDLHEGDEVDGDAFKTLIRAAVALNRSSARAR